MDTMKEVMMDLLQNHPYSEESIFLQKHLKRRVYSKNQWLFYQDEDAHYNYLLHSGLVLLDTYSEENDAHFYDVASPHTVFPLTQLWSNAPYPYDAKAISDVEVWQWRQEDLYEFMKEFPKYWPNLFRDLADLQQYQEERLQVQMEADASQKIQYTLDYLFDLFGTSSESKETIPYRLTITDIASLSGVTRTTASKVMQKLNDMHCIQYVNKTLSR